MGPKPSPWERNPASKDMVAMGLLKSSKAFQFPNVHSSLIDTIWYHTQCLSSSHFKNKPTTHIHEHLKMHEDSLHLTNISSEKLCAWSCAERLPETCLHTHKAQVREANGREQRTPNGLKNLEWAGPGAVHAFQSGQGGCRPGTASPRKRDFGTEIMELIQESRRETFQAEGPTRVTLWGQEDQEGLPPGRP